MSYYIPQYKQLIMINNFSEPKTTNEKLNHFFRSPHNSIFNLNKIYNNSSSNLNIYNFLDIQENKENKIFFGNIKTINNEVNRLKNKGFIK